MNDGVQRRRRKIETLRYQINFLKVKLALTEEELEREKRLLGIAERIRNGKEKKA